jgi:hypothetical protein
MMLLGKRLEGIRAFVCANPSLFDTASRASMGCTEHIVWSMGATAMAVEFGHSIKNRSMFMKCCIKIQQIN